MRHSKILTRSALLGAVTVGLWACSPAEEDTTAEAGMETVENTNATLASVLADMDGSDTIRQAVEEAGLATLLDGSGIYTLLAPSDEAFTALGDRGEQLMGEEQRPLLVGLLREHILPGHVTPEAIETAIEQQEGDVEMTTLGGGTVTFSRDGETIVVTNPDGASARFAGAALAASNGTLIPLDAVLVPSEDGTTAAQ